MTQLDEQLNKLQSAHNQLKMKYQTKEQQVRKYEDVIGQSEEALKKIESNCQKLGSALDMALTEDNL